MKTHIVSFADGWSWLVLVVLAAWALGPVFGTIEGRLNPVLEPATITEPRPFPPPSYQHVFNADSTKLRDCVPMDQNAGLEWFLGSLSDDTGVRVKAFFNDKPKQRLQGVLSWTGLVVQMPPEDVLTFSHSYVYHDCGGWRWWYVKTLFYDSGDISNGLK